MRRAVIRCVASGFVALLAACSSAPIQFHTLVPPPAAAPAQPMAAVPYRIAVMPVSVPAQVDRPQLVVREGQGSVALLDGQQWIAPLGDEIRTVISGELVRRLGTQDVYGLAATGGKPVYRVKVDVTRFESVPSQYTLLAAAWSVQPADGRGPAMQCTSTVRESAGSGYSALVAAHQQGLLALARSIAMAVKRLTLAHETHCPM